MSDALSAGAAVPEPAAVPVVAQRALTAPATVDRAARTVEVVWSTGARARNFVPSLGLITEELEMSPNAVRMEALRSGRAPVLDTHRRGRARDVLGRVTAARLERGRGVATLQFSAAADVDPVWQRIADGTLRAVSVGYASLHTLARRANPLWVKPSLVAATLPHPAPPAAAQGGGADWEGEVAQPASTPPSGAQTAPVALSGASLRAAPRSRDRRDRPPRGGLGAVRDLHRPGPDRPRRFRSRAGGAGPPRASDRTRPA